MFNTITIVGRLGQDPKLSSGRNVSMLIFSVATSESYKKDGEWKEIVTWHNVQVWGKFAETLGSNDRLLKGDLVLVSGVLRQSEGKDKDGNKRTYYNLRAAEVKRLNKREKQREIQVPDEEPPLYDPEEPTDHTPPDDDDIPF